jgi:hypothetical protein
MDQKIFKLEGKKLGVTTRELNAAIKNVEKLAEKAISKYNAGTVLEFIEEGLDQVLSIWKESPKHIEHFKRRFKYEKRVNNRKRLCS